MRSPLTTPSWLGKIVPSESSNMAEQQLCAPLLGNSFLSENAQENSGIRKSSGSYASLHPREHVLGDAVQELQQHVLFHSLSENGRDGLETFFDTSCESLQLLFEQLLSQHGSLRLHESLKALIRTFELEGVVDTHAVEALANAASEDELSSEVDFTQFVAAAQSLKLGALLAIGGIGGGAINTADFSPVKCERTRVQSQLERQAFMYGSRPAWAYNRWVHLSGDIHECAQTLKLLAVKYKLHPLALEDVFGPSTLRSKVQTFEDHLFVLLCPSNDGSPI